VVLSVVVSFTATEEVLSCCCVNCVDELEEPPILIPNIGILMPPPTLVLVVVVLLKELSKDKLVPNNVLLL
jgi:hypothetical protein